MSYHRGVLSRIEHAERAERLLEEGVAVVQAIGAYADLRSENGVDDYQFGEFTRLMDELGKKAMGIWAQAQVHATLATRSAL